MDLILYTVLGAAILVVAVSPRRKKISELSDCKSLELENAKLDHLEVVDVTVNEWLISLILMSGVFYLHRWARLKNTEILFNQMREDKYLQDSKQFADVCSRALKALDESIKINEELSLHTSDSEVAEETETDDLF